MHLPYRGCTTTMRRVIQGTAYFRRCIVLLALTSVFDLTFACSSSDEDTGGCYVARKVNECCSLPIPASQRDLDRDPCLQRWDRAPDIARCPAAQTCNLRTCPDNFVLGTWTRVVAKNGAACAFQHECSTDADCTAARNAARCCSCAEWVPRQLLANDACYVGNGQTASAACDACRDTLPCDACPTAPTGTCRDDAGWKKCL
jgi:hypothetical protein